MGNSERFPVEPQAESASLVGEAEEAWLDEMGRRITAPYRTDRELLEDSLLLLDLRQRLYTQKVRAREWDEEGLNDPEYEQTRRAEQQRLQLRVDRLSERIETKRAIAAGQGQTFLFDRFATKYGLDETELKILLILLLEDITVNGQKTYSRGRDILGILMEDRIDVLAARRYLYPSGALVRSGLMTSSAAAESTVLDAYFKISERAIQELQDPGREAAQSVGQAREQMPNFGRALGEPRFTLDDIVLPPSVLTQVEHVVRFAEHRGTILENWGYGDVHGRTGHSTVLFSGPPGTGKTMAAHAVASSLGQKILMVSYPEVVSKWVGDTEKNLLALFQEAKTHDAVLVFDEADALFYTRMQVSNATDQSFNREVNVLLQEVERFEGVLILTTNRAEGLDPAFERRIAVRAVFPIPDAPLRREIWRRHLPEQAPLAPDVDLEALAQEFPFAGGHIKNATLRAAVAAASRPVEERIIRQADLRGAALEEKRSLHGGEGDRSIGFRVPATA